MLKYIAIFIGGGLGSALRYGISIWASQWWSALGTLISNSLSSLILGISIGILSVSTEEPKLIYLFIAVGFCGGFSTFSTFSNEAFHFIQSGQTNQALIHIFANMALSILAILAGMQLTKLFLA